MKLRVQQGDLLGGEVAEAGDITYVVVYSDDGDPILIAEQVGRNHVMVTRANEVNFAAIADRLGLNMRAVR